MVHMHETVNGIVCVRFQCGSCKHYSQACYFNPYDAKDHCGVHYTNKNSYCSPCHKTNIDDTTTWTPAQQQQWQPAEPDVSTMAILRRDSDGTLKDMRSMSIPKMSTPKKSPPPIPKNAVQEAKPKQAVPKHVWGSPEAPRGPPPGPTPPAPTAEPDALAKATREFAKAQQSMAKGAADTQQAMAKAVAGGIADTRQAMANAVADMAGAVAEGVVDTKQTMATEFHETRTAVAKVTERMGDLEGAVQTVEKEVQKLDTTVETVKTGVQKLDTTVETLQSGVNTVFDKVCTHIDEVQQWTKEQHGFDDLQLEAVMLRLQQVSNAMIKKEDIRDVVHEELQHLAETAAASTKAAEASHQTITQLMQKLQRRQVISMGDESCETDDVGEKDSIWVEEGTADASAC